MHRQSGFTLVEIAIVLVVIGLLLGGVMKGQELIGSAKVKNFAQDFKAAPLLVYGYQDKFRALPGDDANYAANLGSAATAGGATLLAATSETRGNGVLNGAYNSTTATDETVAFWQQVRLAGLANGPTGFATPATDLPRNADNGRIGVQSIAPITGMTGTLFFCSEGIQGKHARQLDATIDDGNTAAGSVRIAAGPYSGTALATVASADVVDANPYIVCQSL